MRTVRERAPEDSDVFWFINDSEGNLLGHLTRISGSPDGSWKWMATVVLPTLYRAPEGQFPIILGTFAGCLDAQEAIQRWHEQALDKTIKDSLAEIEKRYAR
jgi:ribonucleotide reductase alpha subunit